MRESLASERLREPAGVLGRREFLFGGLSAALFAQRTAPVDLRIGLLLPAGPLAPAILRGAQLGSTEADSLAQMFGKKILLERPAIPGPERLADAAAALIEQGVPVLVGGANEREAEILRDVARDGRALFLNVGSASSRLRTDRCDRHTFHLHASTEMHVGAAGVWLLEEKKLQRWAVLAEADDLRRAVVALAEARGAQVVESAPASSGTRDWRPSIERLQAAAPEVLWLGLGADGLASFLEQRARARLAAELVGLAPDGVGPPKLEGLAASGVWPLMWHDTLVRYSARELNRRFSARFGEPLDGAGWAAWAACKLVGEAMLRAGATPRALLEYFESDPAFDGHKGQALTFRKRDHQLRQPMYLAQAAEPPAGESGATGVEVLAEVPSRGELDAIFLPSSEGGCLQP